MPQSASLVPFYQNQSLVLRVSSCFVLLSASVALASLGLCALVACSPPRCRARPCSGSSVPLRCAVGLSSLVRPCLRCGRSILSCLALPLGAKRRSGDEEQLRRNRAWRRRAPCPSRSPPRRWCPRSCAEPRPPAVSPSLRPSVAFLVPAPCIHYTTNVCSILVYLIRFAIFGG